MVQEKVTLKKTIKDIWGSVTRKNVQLKLQIKQDLPWTIIGKDLKLKQFTKMYNGYHVRYKYRFLKPLFYIAIYVFAKFNRLILGKSYIPTEKVSKEKANTLINTWNLSVEQTCKENLLILKKDLKGYKNPDSKYWVKFTKLINNIFMQNILYDTFFRGFFEMFVINLTNNMNKIYSSDKKHILYNKKQLDDIDFWMAVERNDGNHLVMQENDNSIIVVPRGAALRLQKQDIEILYNALKKEENNNKKQD